MFDNNLEGQQGYNIYMVGLYENKESSQNDKGNNLASGNTHKIMK